MVVRGKPLGIKEAQEDYLVAEEFCDMGKHLEAEVKTNSLSPYIHIHCMRIDVILVVHY